MIQMNFVNLKEAIYAHDGGDCPELGMEGILMALKLSFENSLFFSASGCGDFAEYKYVQEKTGGIFVSTIESFRSLSLFISDLRSELSSRSIHSVDSSLTSSHKCQLLIFQHLQSSLN